MPPRPLHLAGSTEALMGPHTGQRQCAFHVCTEATGVV